MAPLVLQLEEETEQRVHEMIEECFAHEMLVLVAIDQISMIVDFATIADAAIVTTGENAARAGVRFHTISRLARDSF